ncbi:Trehalose-6-phosphate phosphatase [Candidatus Burkholderia pumila]|uniref:Trehalose-6-phosphate phosphatase n=1 Tax=Candidatus Burkholderia pumila TaxID=1090375 RepID=A0ABR5HMT2_9BURK|nr:Trehalose-6-phosphate phosphatase [Candidatus Burkholderia pumila]
MSHEHAPHDHAVEHAAPAGDPLSRWVAVFTAILAALSRLLHFKRKASVLQTQALIFKNEAVLLQSKTSDQWSYYQAQSSKGHLMDCAAELTTPERKPFYQSQIVKYEDRKKEIAAKAQALEKQIDEANHCSVEGEHPQHLFGQALAWLSVAMHSRRSHRLREAAGCSCWRG